MKAATAIAAEMFNVGDYIVSTWGYEQTNVDFFKVVKVGNKTVKVVKVGNTVTEYTSHGMSGWVVPVDANVSGEEIAVRVSDHMRVRGYYATKWNGRPQHATWYA